MKELALHILDIVENCISAGAARVRCRIEERESGMLILAIEDDGKGMSDEQLQHATDPFYTSRTTRRVGLGLPLIKQQAEQCGGYFRLDSEQGKGTVVEAGFELDHPDRQPMGDLVGSWLLLASLNPSVEWELICSSPQDEFSISSSEIKEALEVEEIKGRELMQLLNSLIRNNIDELGVSW